ncbi:MAG: hypothetical protein ACXWID_09405 [Pyrinomonadaceae bacterium]
MTDDEEAPHDQATAPDGAVTSAEEDRQDRGRAVMVLALFDVLGFSERVRRIGLDAIYRHYDELINLVRAKAGGKVVISALPTGDGGMVPVSGWLLIEHTYFSDTILLWCPYHPAMSIPFFDVCLDFVCEALARELPIRGCISFGEAIMDRKLGVFLGNPIVEAARGEAAQSWLGVSFGPSLDTPEFSYLGDLRMVLPFDQQIKQDKGDLVTPLALDWPRRWRDKFQTDPISQLNSLDVDLRFSAYYETARHFCAFSAANPEWWKKYDFDKRAFV